MSGNSKKRTTINIAGREYCIVSPEDTDYIQRISMQLDSRIRELSDAYFSLFLTGCYHARRVKSHGRLHQDAR